MKLKLKLAPANQGALWVRRGFAVFFKQPLAFTALFTGFLFSALLVLLVPLLGPLLLLMSLPLVSLGFMLATQRTLQDRLPSPSVVVEPLRVDRVQTLSLAKMGLLYALGSVVIMTLCHWADGGKLAALQDAMAKTNGSAEELAALLADGQLQWGLLLRLGLAALMSLPFWHAPALVHWGGLGVGKALFFSSVACWRNWTAFVVYALTWVAVIVLLGALADALVLLVLPPQWVAMAAIPVGLLLSTVFYASLYFSFADCFTQADAAS